MRVAPYSTQSGGASTLTKDRGCMYYVPWIVTFLLLIMGAAVGVWAWYGDQARQKTQSGLDQLNISSDGFERLRPALIATAVVFIVLLALIAILSYAHSFVEAALDATGTAGAGSKVYLVLNAIEGTLWYIVTVWLIFVLIGCSLWAAYIYLMRGALNTKINQYDANPPPPWTPSSGLPCPCQCFDLTYFNFVSSRFAVSCTCDKQAMQGAYDAFNDVYMQYLIAVLVGAFVMLVSASLLGMNLACQFSHTKRHREMIFRATQKFYAGYL